MSDLTEKYPIVLKQSLIWGDMDAYDHINNTVYFRYFEDARIAYFDKIGVNQYKREHQIGPILASTKCDFRLPLQYPDNIQITATIRDIKEKRFSMKYQVFSEKFQGLAAEGEALVVFYDYGVGKSCAIPKSIVEAIEKIESSYA